MFKFHSKKIIVCALVGVVGLTTSCAGISKFDQYSYTQATSLKVDALNIMANASDNFNLHQTQIVAVKTNLTKAYEYESNKPKNTISTKMWAMLIDSTGNSFGGFISRWQKENRLDTAFIRQSQMLIGQSFDQISGLESGKIK
jgi:hypothetical protein